ncbi:MAG: cell division topological specificity factor MinE, partial [Rhodospirillaceae bacterium]
IAKYVDVDQNRVEVKLDRGNDFSTLEVNIELPSTSKSEPVRFRTSATTSKDPAAKSKEKEAVAGS